MGHIEGWRLKGYWNWQLTLIISWPWMFECRLCRGVYDILWHECNIQLMTTPLKHEAWPMSTDFVPDFPFTSVDIFSIKGSWDLNENWPRACLDLFQDPWKSCDPYADKKLTKTWSGPHTITDPVLQIFRSKLHRALRSESFFSILLPMESPSLWL